MRFFKRYICRRHISIWHVGRQYGGRGDVSRWHVCRWHDNLRTVFIMEQCALKNVNICWNIAIPFYLKTSGGQNSNPYLNVVHFSNRVLIRYLWHIKTVVFLDRCQICVLLLVKTEKFCKKNFHWGVAVAQR